MKTKLFIFAAFAALLLASCKDLAEPENPRVPVTDIVVASADENVSIVKSRTHTLNASVKPDNATDKTLTYSSRNTNVATVDANGLISAKTAGSATLTISAADGVSKTINVTVTEVEIPVTSIVFDPPIPTDPIELTIGDNYELKLKVIPENATNKMLSVASSNDDIAWPNEEGNRWIKAKQAGSATITITSVGTPAVKRDVLFVIKNPPEIKYDSKTAVMAESAAGTYTFELQTLNGKLEYTPEVVGGGKEWLTFSNKDTSNAAKDTITLSCTENKTVWYRNAYVKFRGAGGNYIKSSDGKKDLEVKLTQKRNDSPSVTIMWVNGIEKPSEDEKKKVPVLNAGIPTGEYYDNKYVFTWDETENTKFFNVRKLAYTGTLARNKNAPNDHKQCWAMTASNMLHWWFEQNEDNIRRYKEKKHIDNNDERYQHYYKRGMLSDDHEDEKTPIANVFRKNCQDHGNFINIGLQWYLFGKDNFAKNKTYSPKLFADVFDNDANNPVAIESFNTKEDFERIVKDALNSNKAIGLETNDAGQGLHAITLWGAAFDAEDNIIAIYVVDNNIKDNRMFTYGIHYLKDIYADNNDNAPYLINYAASGSYVYDKDKHIDRITTLDKGEKQWQDWFAKHP